MAEDGRKTEPNLTRPSGASAKVRACGWFLTVIQAVLRDVELFGLGEATINKIAAREDKLSRVSSVLGFQRAPLRVLERDYGDENFTGTLLEVNHPQRGEYLVIPIFLHQTHEVETEEHHASSQRILPLADSDLEELKRTLECWRRTIEDMATSDGENEKTSTAPPDGEWSVPMSKAEFARRLTGNAYARARDVEGLFNRHGLKHIDGNKWSLRLDAMDDATRRRVTVKKPDHL